MAIRPPSWCANAVPTPRGWTDPKTGELLKAVKIKSHMIDEWHADHPVEEPVVQVDPNLHTHPDGTEHSHGGGTEPHHHHEDGMTHDHEDGDMPHTHTDADMLIEAPANDKSLDEMTKIELEALGRQHGVELDRRKSKQTLIEKMKNLVG